MRKMQCNMCGKEMEYDRGSGVMRCFNRSNECPQYYVPFRIPKVEPEQPKYKAQK